MIEVCNSCEVISPPSKIAVVSLTKHLNPTFSFWEQKRTVTCKDTTRMQSAKSRLKNCMTTDSVSSRSICKGKGKQESKRESDWEHEHIQDKKKKGRQRKGEGKRGRIRDLEQYMGVNLDLESNKHTIGWI